MPCFFVGLAVVHQRKRIYSQHASPYKRMPNLRNALSGTPQLIMLRSARAIEETQDFAELLSLRQRVAARTFPISYSCLHH
jgi:hypothetical protein